MKNFLNSIRDIILIAFLIFFVVVVVESAVTSTFGKKDSIKEVVEDVTFDKVVYFGNNGHDYIDFQVGESHNIIHNPDCHCLK